MTIDAHQHFWYFDPVRDEWITPAMARIRRDFLPEDLYPVLKANGIDGCVAVQAAQSEAETEFLLRLSEAHTFIRGVVGWVDLRSKNLPERLEYYRQFKKIKGFRHIVQAEPDDFLRRPEFINGVRQLAAFGYTYDILIYPSQLAAALYFVEQLPEVNFVLDHLAKPYIKSGAIEAWARDLRRLAAHPHVCCKLSGLVTEADWSTWTPETFVPYLDVAFEAFGPQRLLYGSDWPVCLVAGEYDEALTVLTQYLNDRPDYEKDAVMGNNALRFYGLN